MTQQTGTVRIGYAYGYINNLRVRVMYFDYTDSIKINSPTQQTGTQITNKIKAKVNLL